MPEKKKKKNWKLVNHFKLKTLLCTLGCENMAERQEIKYAQGSISFLSALSLNRLWAFGWILCVVYRAEMRWISFSKLIWMFNSIVLPLWKKKHEGFVGEYSDSSNYFRREGDFHQVRHQFGIHFLSPLLQFVTFPISSLIWRRTQQIQKQVDESISVHFGSSFHKV